MAESKARKFKIGRPPRFTEEEMNQLCEDLLEEAINNEDFLTLHDIYLFCGMSNQTAAENKERFPQFSDAIGQCRRIIGARRERGGLKGKLDAGIVKKAAGLYCPDMEAYEMRLKNADFQAAGRVLRLYDKGAMDKSDPEDSSE